MASFRWFPFDRADGAHNMAADDVLLRAAADQGLASLRFYGWTVPTVSLGYFQPAAVRKQHVHLAQLPWVRRPSGGKTLVHHHELTYALALPPGFSSGWLLRMHERVILPPLSRLGPSGKIQVVGKEPRILGEFLCFSQQTSGDLVCQGSKIVGSAQRKHRQALLQHGAILLARSEHTPELPGIKELIGVELGTAELQEEVVDSFQRETGLLALRAEWNRAEKEAIQETVRCQYGHESWNRKR